MKGLYEFSKSYYEENDYYEKFSLAEDKPEYILNFLLEQTKDKAVLDLGCGTGKYSAKLIKTAKRLVGVDKSENQIKIAKSKVKNKDCFIVADASLLPFENESFDVVISCWCVGTIQDKNTQQKVLNEVKRVLKPNGVAYFIENDIGGEFEQIRGRFPNIARTQNYNNFLQENGFCECKKINTYFEFPSYRKAQDTFARIWGEDAASKITSNIIQHNVIIYKFAKC